MLPDHVAATATQTWGEAGRAWVARFPETLGWVCTQWGLTDLRPFPDLSYHFVARALCARGPVVLKLGVPNQELACEAATLAAFQGRGCVPLLRVDLADGALLLEDLSPARSLAELWSPGTDAEQTGLLGTAMAKLWRDPPDWRMPTTG
ncbi:MAG TPA: aminoglycoside phosphotransferase family protein, partial [bacterium]|nr:aminoglycoside phosphotransferase family protein [bacterium]